MFNVVVTPLVIIGKHRIHQKFIEIVAKYRIYSRVDPSTAPLLVISEKIKLNKLKP